VTSLYKRLSLLFFLIGIITSSCNPENTSQAVNTSSLKPYKKSATASKNIIKKEKFNLYFNNCARFLAGLEIKDSLFNHWTLDSAYQRYKSFTDSNFKALEEKRFSLIKKWQDSIISPLIMDSLNVFYPFSGPDFIHVNPLFPKTKYILMLANEPLGSVPDFSEFADTTRNQYIQKLANSLSDIYKKSYFITRKMNEDFSRKNVNGVIPVFMFFFARSNYNVLDITRTYIDSSGKCVNEILNDSIKQRSIKGVRFLIEDHTNQQRKIVEYFKCDLSNEGFKAHPEFNLFLENKPNVNTFVKSASYLMHYNTFKQIREITLNISDAILEDDTGIPYKYFKNWGFLPFGQYTMPVKDFSNVFQPDLDSAYKKVIPSPLPFSLGYHWGTKKQNYMLFTR
jgi:hypothetical protein